MYNKRVFKSCFQNSFMMITCCSFLLPFQTISNVLLSYADVISKLFANYVTMEKVVSGRKVDESVRVFTISSWSSNI